MYFGGEGVAGEMNRGEKLLEFEGHHSRSINVKHSALLSDIIKRLSPHPACLSTTHSVCLHLFFSHKKENPFFRRGFVLLFLVSLALCHWLIFSLRLGRCSPRL